eukprot:TRINITY_DN5338_c0_g1_i1.p1 TRINITY_DN5338_c0_g1~~TRINITY_DN5338_c0_g1_i1.p1  ORF type:complete len:323 (+),score=56.23 TRINITY_DN5338_c0_g1_i1:63-1031(+)
MGDGSMNTEVPISEDGVVYHLLARKEDIADNIILVGDPGRVPFVASFFDSGSIRYKGNNREIVTITGTYKGVPLTAMSTGMGTDNCEIVMTELHILKEFDPKSKTWGPRHPLNIIRCGTCGSPHDGMEAGTLVVTDLSVGLDNTGKFYNSESVEEKSPNGKLSTLPGIKELRTALSNSGLKNIGCYTSTAHPDIKNTMMSIGESRDRRVMLGHTASAPGFYACQGRRVGRLSGLEYPDLPAQLNRVRALNRPVMNLEMETSSICQISHILGYKAGTVCVVVASRASGKASLLPDDQKVPAMRDCVLLAMDTLAKLAVSSSKL